MYINPRNVKLAVAIFIVLDIALVTGACIWYFGSVLPASQAQTKASQPKKIHYHANFRVFLDTDYVNFDGDGYMEEDASCAVDPNKETPQDRVHLHDNKGSLVHVHDAGATWGHLASNLGWNFGPSYVVDGKGTIRQNAGKKKVRFVLNGKLVPNVQNREIQSEDRLLIDYSDASDADVLKRFETVPATAHEQNSLPDPAACGWHDE